MPPGPWSERLRAGQIARVVLRGPRGSGRRESARWLAGQLGREVIEVTWPSPPPPPEWRAALVRHLLVRNAALVVLPPAIADDAPVIELPLPEDTPAFLVADERSELLGASTFSSADRLVLDAPGPDERAELWREGLELHGVEGPDPHELGWSFRVRGGEIALVIDDAVRRMQGEQRSRIGLEDLTTAMRERPARKLEG